MVNIHPDNNIIELVYQSLTGELDAAQAAQLNDWLNVSPGRLRWYESLDQSTLLATALEQQAPDRVDVIVKELHTRIAATTGITASLNTSATTVPPVHRIHFLRRWGWVAAIIILLSGSGIYYFNHQSSKSSAIIGGTGGTVGTRENIAPGTDKAIWILSDGKQVELDSSVLDMTVKHLYAENIGYNELRTPRGGQYQLILPDGSKVWLNAASSIKYPVAFEEKERRVDVTGEAYFEIEKDVKKTFKVYSGGLKIEVLGTAFNVNAYDNESFKTSLAAGAVKVNQILLKPGQAYTNGKIITTNIEHDLAWKNGIFNFQNADLRSVMKQIERWYDVDVQYTGQLPDIEFRGKMDRGVPFSGVLRFLSAYGINTKLEGRTLMVSGE